MSGRPKVDEDLERAGPSMDSQRNDQVGGKAKNAATTAGETSALVDAWMHRLQMLTLVTTFLASIDGELFTLTNTSSQVTVDASLGSQEFVYACFSGALIFHVCAAILGYVASFALIRYELIHVEVPSGTESNVQGELASSSEARHGVSPRLLTPPPFDIVKTPFQTPQMRLEAHSRTFTPPLALLARCYYTTLVLSSVGFIAALLGITTYAWKGLQQTVGIFTTACLGISVLAGVWASM